MRKLFRLIPFLFLIPCELRSQTDTLVINGFTFITVRKTEWSEYQKKDTVIKFYRLENGKPKYLLKHYIYQWSGDCNNEFEDFGSYEIRNDSIIFMTDYSQKTGMDPIPTQRKQIYIVRSDGKLIEVYDKQLERSGEWEDVND